MTTIEQECGYCEGRGRLAGGLGDRCRICDGIGNVVLTVLDGALPEEPGGRWEAYEQLRAEKLPELFGNGPINERERYAYEALRNGRTVAEQQAIDASVYHDGDATRTCPGCRVDMSVQFFGEGSVCSWCVQEGKGRPN